MATEVSEGSDGLRESERNEDSECETAIETAMETSMETMIDDLPHVVFEYILSQLSPYRELLHCKMVCKAWHSAVISTIGKLKRDFIRSLSSPLPSIEWEHYYPRSGGPAISPRYSHSACCFGDSLYIFGGCTTANTTFNDLWRFDLSTRCWIRPIATGTFPSPKACASLVNYKSKLILFGGWTHSSPYPIHQEWRIFNHIHIFDTNTNRWSFLESKCFSPAIAGHTASVINDEMIIFGGLQSQSNSSSPFSSSNDIWVLNLNTYLWRKQLTSHTRPLPRYGHSQIVIDSKHILIIGGSGGPNMLFSDIWLLSLHSNKYWEWTLIDVEVKNLVVSPQISFHPACKIGSFVVILNANQKSRSVQCKDGNILRKPSIRNQYVNSSESANINVSQQKLVPQTCSSKTVATLPAPECDLKLGRKSHSRRNRERQLEGLDRMEQRIRRHKANTFSPLSLKSETIKSCQTESNGNPMQLHSLDISEVVSHRRAQWLQLSHFNSQGPEEVILYSLVAGRAEIIMFGGIQKDKNLKQMQQQDIGANVPDIVSNHLHIISAKREII